MKAARLVALPLLLLVGCASAAPADTASDESALSADTDAGDSVFVTAAWHYAVTGTPTIGNAATTPFLSVRARVVDVWIRKDHPAFDGLERPFVMVPRADGSRRRVELTFESTALEGYIELHPVDAYALTALALTEADLEAVRTNGLRVGLDTNVGTLWTGTITVGEGW